jgi:hypothetical protein
MARRESGESSCPPVPLYLVCFSLMLCGLREKWTLFDESTRVPLLISHPSSPFQNQRYSHPVELIDIFPTILDLLHVIPTDPCPNIKSMHTCRPLQGKSLAPVVLGANSSYLSIASHHLSSSEKGFSHSLSPSQLYSKRLVKQQQQQQPQHLRRALSSSNQHGHAHAHDQQKSHSHNNKKSQSRDLVMPTLTRKFAVSQMWRCVPKNKIENKADTLVSPQQMLTATAAASASPADGAGGGVSGQVPRDYNNPWFECNRAEAQSTAQLSVMGYSFRTSDFRYNVYYHFDRVNNVPLYTQPPYAEELYDHRGEVLSNFTHLELANLLVTGRQQESVGLIAAKMRQMALQFLQQEVVFHGPYPAKKE